MSCFEQFITLDSSTPSESGLYVVDLPGVTVAQLDGVTKDEQSGTDELFENIYKNAQINLKIDLQRKLAQRFHIDRKLVSRETSAYLTTINQDSGAGILISHDLSKYSINTIQTVELNVEDFLDVTDAADEEWAEGEGDTIVDSNDIPDSYHVKAAYGNGVWVIIGGNGGEVLNSTDGKTWKAVYAVAGVTEWYDLVFGDGKFVAVFSSSVLHQQVATSPDGKNWTLRSSASASVSTDNSWQSIAFGNGLYVAVAQSIAATGTGFDQAMVSDNGINWTIGVTPESDVPRRVAYGNGVFVAVTSDIVASQVITSTDGITWTAYVSAAQKAWKDIASDDSRFVAVSETGEIMSSDDNGATWTSRTPPTAGIAWRRVAYGAEMWIATAEDGRTMLSADGTTWVMGETIPTNAIASSTYNIGYSDGLFVVTGINGGAIHYLPLNFVTINFYQDNASGELLHSVSEAVTIGRNTIEVYHSFEVDDVFVSVDASRWNIHKTESKSYPNTYYRDNKLSCTFPCAYGGDGVSITHVSGGGLNVKFVIACSFERLICENLSLFQYALWYRMGVDLMKERRVSDRVTRFSVISPERAVELMAIFNEDYQAALEAATMNIKMQEDAICFLCKRPIQAVTSLP